MFAFLECDPQPLGSGGTLQYQWRPIEAVIIWQAFLHLAPVWDIAGCFVTDDTRTC